MKAKTITDEEVELLKVASLPNRPTAPEEYGGSGFSAREMKEAFDRLPLYLMQRFNELIDDISAEGADSVAHAIKVGLGEEVSLRDFIDWFGSGKILAYIPVGDGNLAYFLANLRKDIDRCLEKLELES
ncbi:MAG: hypothetical protein IJF05_06405 [Clostridia bacterium]|nr:hypothetical protein [Clostridia bacterium]